MLNALRDLFASILPQADAGAPVDLRLAVAVLIVEVMRAEPAYGDVERQASVAALRAAFGLDDVDVARLFESAERASGQATDLFTFTSRINASFDMPQKLTLLEHLWRVVWADGRLGANENHVMRKIADLLYIPQGAYVHAKARARGNSAEAASGA